MWCTGSRKSSLVKALFRILEYDSLRGYIEIDGIKTCDVGLHELRANWMYTYVVYGAVSVWMPTWATAEEWRLCFHLNGHLYCCAKWIENGSSRKICGFQYTWNANGGCRGHAFKIQNLIWYWKGYRKMATALTNALNELECATPLQWLALVPMISCHVNLPVDHVYSKF